MDSVVVVHGEVERGLWAGKRACHGVKSRMQQQVAAEHAFHAGAMGGVEDLRWLCMCGPCRAVFRCNAVGRVAVHVRVGCGEECQGHVMQWLCSGARGALGRGLCLGVSSRQCGRGC